MSDAVRGKLQLVVETGEYAGPADVPGGLLGYLHEAQLDGLLGRGCGCHLDGAVHVLAPRALS